VLLSLLYRLVRQEENNRHAAKGLPPKTRRRRRKTLTATASADPP